MKWVLFNLMLLLCFHYSSSQQHYTANQVLNCKTKDEFLYTCKGESPNCKSFLIFRSQPPFDSVATISALMSSNPHELALINNVTETFVFKNGKQVIIPVNCSCSDHRYQAATTFRLAPHAKTYFIVANFTFQGLSTCSSLMRANSYGEFDLEIGFELKVPLRCACPTKDQILRRTKYLLTYSIVFNDNVHDVARRFNVTAESVRKANGFSKTNPTLFPFTTILIPVPAKPSISETLETTTVSGTKRSKAKNRLKFGIEAAAVCCFLVFMAVILVTVLGLRRKAKIRDSAQIAPTELLAEIASFERIIKAYSFPELQKATSNFSHKSKINGSVYRGVFGNQIAAVKKTGIDESKQVNMLSKINHINLTKLYGFCNNQDSLYLVFEYMTMGSLREWLNGERCSESHGFGKRVQIAIDVAHGLHYLHNFVNPMYVHKNINSSNILLDNNFRAKISNFSLARTTTDSDGFTTRIVGERGYMAPEYVCNGSVTAKVDVYSFGVVMFELVSGKCAVFIEGGEEVLLSAAMAAIMEGENAEMEVMCMSDLDNGSMECALEMVKLGLRCVKQDPASRPSMDDVVSCLVRIDFDLRKSVRRAITKSDPCN